VPVFAAVAGVWLTVSSISVRVLDAAGEELLARTFAHDEAGLKSLCRVSCGGAPLEIIKRYTQSQRKDALKCGACGVHWSSRRHRTNAFV
jgi:hypothetical protein